MQPNGDVDAVDISERRPLNPELAAIMIAPISPLPQMKNNHNQESAARFNPTNLRVVLLADNDTLSSYGPILRRLVVGLLDEVADLTLLSLDESHWPNYLPSPPLRIIRQMQHLASVQLEYDMSDRHVLLRAPYYSLTDRLFRNRAALRLADALSTYKPTLLHALSERQMLLARRISKYLRVPYVVSLLRLPRWRWMFSQTRCGGVLPYGSELARRLRTAWPKWSSRIHPLPIGTHVTKLPCAFAHGRQKTHIFCCAPLEENYGVANLINAVARLRQNGHNLFLTLSGRGHAKSDFWEQVQRLNLNRCVTFIEPLDTILNSVEAYKGIFRSVDIFVRPWPAEEFRADLLEAMSVGAAVVAATNGTDDLLIDEKTALIAPFRDDIALAATLERLLKDPALGASLGANAQAYVRKHFLASRMVTRLTHAYHDALAATRC